MPKPSLKPEYKALELAIIETFLAGHHEWRPDLAYPESYSDMQGGVRALLRRFNIIQRPIDLSIDHFISDEDKNFKGF